MAQTSWKSQIVNGRVFELRSRSTHYPAPCALVINEKANGRVERIFAAVDRLGVIGDGLYHRTRNPNIPVDWLLPEQFNSSRVVRRRRDLERFDADDLALIRYGLAIDFSGQIHGRYSDITIPTLPADWTVFWLGAWTDREFRWIDNEPELAKLLHGAWHFISRGGRRDLGYRFGHAWGTRHTGERLNQIRRFLRTRYGSRLVEQPVKVVRWFDGQRTITEEVRRDSPALGSRHRTIDTPTGSTMCIYG